MKKISIKNILIPVDFTDTSDAATANGIKIAALLKANIFLIHVMEFNAYNYSVFPETEIVIPSVLELESAVDKKMNLIKEKIRKKFSIIPKVLVSIGDVPSEIIRFSKKEKIDLIVMGTHGISGYKELFIGSNAQRVVTLSEIPVLTMQKSSGKCKFKKILLPIDNSLHSREKVNLAMIIADLFKAKIQIIGLPDSKEKKVLNMFNIKCRSVEKIIAADELPFKTTLVYGINLAEASIKFASKNKCDLIVINTGHESEVTGIFMGAFAQQIVNHSKIPVLSFKHSEGHFSIDTSGFGIS